VKGYIDAIVGREKEGSGLGGRKNSLVWMSTSPQSHQKKKSKGGFRKSFKNLSNRWGLGTRKRKEGVSGLS
jgi:hypothetical protein